MSARKLAELSRSELRREVKKSVLLMVAMTVGTIAIYFTIPFEGLHSSSQAVMRLITGLIGFGVVIFFLIRRILKSDIPQLRAAETVVITFIIFLCAYASIYLGISQVDSNTFNTQLTHMSALYFTVVTFGTVGYGDISANTDLARMLVAVQILIDWAYIGVIVRLVFLASQRTLSGDNT